MKGTVFNIKRYAIHDGPGIRTTVFLKGCRLSCPWCQNPEGVKFEPELIWHAQRCIACGSCKDACPVDAVSLSDAGVRIDKDLCDTCGLCATACHAEALEVIGQAMSVEAVMTEIRKDKIFFGHSGGGITVSGGEPLAQPDFLEGILRACKQDGIHTALDTSGHTERDTLLRIAEYVDLFLWDIKVMDDEDHRRLTGASNAAILENLEAASGLGKQTVIRFTLIPGVNDDTSGIRRMGALAASLDSVVGMDLLPYHNGWIEKYRGLNRTGEPAVFDVPPTELLDATATKLAGFGLKTRIGG